MSTRQRKQGMELKGMKPISNKKLSHFLIIASTMLSLCILSLFKACYCPAPHVHISKENLKLQNDLKMVTEEEDMYSFFQDDEDDEEPGSKPLRPKPICYESSLRSDTCEAIGDIRVDSGSRTAFLNTSRPLKIKPYTRKSDSVLPWPPSQRMTCSPLP
ncbi:uncharacterized protein A4U43_C06F6680 [Asparagus officinalis]|uniref:Uncharacterized protein n=1 Tax=Asparagus officinalis TaxID=4686 RepID=A0A5P1EKB4_ASPOF|nr:uncharacterized protein A4U43_C06F6680 [Asparagus officinalis]